ncbi:hypothetical protein [Azospirillum argentinense]
MRVPLGVRGGVRASVRIAAPWAALFRADVGHGSMMSWRAGLAVPAFVALQIRHMVCQRHDCWQHELLACRAFHPKIFSAFEIRAAGTVSPALRAGLRGVLRIG